MNDINLYTEYMIRFAESTKSQRRFNILGANKKNNFSTLCTLCQISDYLVSVHQTCHSK